MHEFTNSTNSDSANGNIYSTAIRSLREIISGSTLLKSSSLVRYVTLTGPWRYAVSHHLKSFFRNDLVLAPFWDHLFRICCAMRKIHSKWCNVFTYITQIISYSQQMPSSTVQKKNNSLGEDTILELYLLSKESKCDPVVWKMFLN